MAQSRMTGPASLPLTTNEPPTLISWKLAASVPGVADRFPIAGPPSEKFAVEPDAPIDVKECCGIGLRSVGRRRPRERHSV